MRLLTAGDQQSRPRSSRRRRAAGQAASATPQLSILVLSCRFLAHRSELISQSFGKLAERVRGLTEKLVFFAQRRKALLVYVRFHSQGSFGDVNYIPHLDSRDAHVFAMS